MVLSTEDAVLYSAMQILHMQALSYFKPAHPFHPIYIHCVITVLSYTEILIFKKYFFSMGFERNPLFSFCEEEKQLS